METVQKHERLRVEMREGQVYYVFYEYLNVLMDKIEKDKFIEAYQLIGVSSIQCLKVYLRTSEIVRVDGYEIYELEQVVKESR